MVPLTITLWAPTPFPEYAWCDPELRDMAFASDTSGIVVGGCMSLYRTIDGGATWVRDASTGDIGDLNAIHLRDGLALAVGRNAINQPTVLVSNDGGASFDWRIFYLTDPSGVWNEGQLTDVRALSPTTAIATARAWSGEGVIVGASDAGDTWTTIAWLPDALHGLDASGARAIAVGANGAVYVSDDAGATWSPRTSGTVATLRDVLLDGANAYAIGDAGAAIRSSDAGETWIPMAPGTAVDLRSIARDGEALVIAGAAGTILRSTDGGATWTPEVTLASSDLDALAFRPDGAGFAGGVAEMVMRTAVALV